MQPRRIARELALLSMSQLPNKQEKLLAQSLQSLVLAAVRTLTAEVHDALEAAAAELDRGSDRLLSSETRAVDLNSARAMVQEAIELSQKAINRLGTSLELPEFVQLANQQDVRDYAMELLTTIYSQQEPVDELLTRTMVNWRLDRLPRIDRDILRIAVTEIVYLDMPQQSAINEAVELAKRYSGEDGYKFINGVLRRVSDELREAKRAKQN